MKLTTGNVYDAHFALRAIVNTKRVLPQIAKYRLARMAKAIASEFTHLEEVRVALVKELGAPVADDKGVETGWQVPTEKMEEYMKRWNEVRAQVIEVNVEPIYLFALGDDPDGIETKEFDMLGDLVTDHDGSAMLKPLTPTGV